MSGPPWCFQACSSPGSPPRPRSRAPTTGVFSKALSIRRPPFPRMAMLPTFSARSVPSMCPAYAATAAATGRRTSVGPLGAALEELPRIVDRHPADLVLGHAALAERRDDVELQLRVRLVLAREGHGQAVREGHASIREQELLLVSPAEKGLDAVDVLLARRRERAHRMRLIRPPPAIEAQVRTPLQEPLEVAQRHILRRAVHVGEDDPRQVDAAFEEDRRLDDGRVVA